MNNFKAEIIDLTKVYWEINNNYSLNNNYNLTNEELVEIIVNGSSIYDVEELKAILVSKNMGLIINKTDVALTGRFTPVYSSGEDFLQLAISAVLEAIYTYDASKAKFSTYIGYVISRSINEELGLGNGYALSAKGAYNVSLTKKTFDKYVETGYTNFEEICTLVAKDLHIKKVKTVKKHLMAACGVMGEAA